MTTSPGKRRGRKPALTEEDYPVLRELLRKNPAATPAVLRPQLQERLGKSGGSDATLYRHIQNAGFSRHKRPPAPPPQRTPEEEAAQRETRYQDRHRIDPTPTTYPSDLTDAQWTLIEPLLRPPGHKQCAPTTRRIVDALLYMARTGCQWRYLPRDFPHWGTVSKQFYRWKKRGVWPKLNAALRTQLREAAGRDAQPSAGIVDSQSVKTTEKGGSADLMVERKSMEESAISWSTQWGSFCDSLYMARTSRTGMAD